MSTHTVLFLLDFSFSAYSKAGSRSRFFDVSVKCSKITLIAFFPIDTVSFFPSLVCLFHKSSNLNTSINLSTLYWINFFVS